jgi:hypothetical protein
MERSAWRSRSGAPLAPVPCQCKNNVLLFATKSSTPGGLGQQQNAAADVHVPTDESSRRANTGQSHQQVPREGSGEHKEHNAATSERAAMPLKREMINNTHSEKYVRAGGNKGVGSTVGAVHKTDDASTPVTRQGAPGHND